MGSKIALKNAQDQEFSINHQDNAGAISINSDKIVAKNSDGSLTIKGVQDSAVISATELVTNGTFTGNATGWTLGTNWAYSSNAIVCTLNDSAEGTISQNVNVVSGKNYMLTWSQTNSIDTNGQVTPSIGTVIGSKHSLGTTAQTFTVILNANATGSLPLTFTVDDISSTGTITIDNVSLKEITGIAPTLILPTKGIGERNIEMRVVWNGVNNSNLGIGLNALQNNTTGYGNVANGPNALKSNTTGYYNTANGVNALANNTTGYSNTASGAGALQNNTTGYYNTACGDGALYDNTTFFNSSGLGRLAQVTGSNQVQLGDSATTTYVYGTVQNRSDIRDKADVRDTVLGLDFIQSLRPVDYKWDMREDYKPEKPELEMPKLEDEDYEAKKAEYEEIMSEWLEACKHENIVRDGSKKRNRYHQGFIAQEVQALEVEFGGLQDHSITGGHDVLSIGYDELIAPLVKGMQEQQAMIAELRAEINTLKGA